MARPNAPFRASGGLRGGHHRQPALASPNGMRSFLGAARRAHIAVLHLVASAAVVVVEEQVTFKALNAGRWVPSTRTQVSVFEIVDGRIGHVVELWQPH